MFKVNIGTQVNFINIMKESGSKPYDISL